MRPATLSFEPRPRVPLLLVPLLVLATVGLHVAFAGRYGYFRDELYFIICGQRLAWGYVDQPPGIALATRVATELFGTSLTGFRLIPALVSGALVGLTCHLARRFGGGGFAVALAALPAALAPIYLAHGHLFTMNTFEPLLWTACAVVLVHLIDSEDRSLWVPLGLLVGVGLLTKHSMGFYAACLGLGVLLSPARRFLASRWLLVGALLTVAVVGPHVWWQWQHGFPMFELLRNGQLHKNAPFSLSTFLGGQLLLVHPLSVPLWLAGLGFLLVSQRGRPYRALGWGFVLLLGLFVALKAKDYYLAPAYPVLLAAGAPVWERAVRHPWLRAAVLVPAVVAFAVLVPLALPVLPVERFLAWQRTLGVSPPKLERKEYRELPQHYADQHGWEELVATVAQVYGRLTPEERKRTALYAQNYGQAGALDWLGRRYGLPPARSGHNHYWLWGPGEEPAHLLVVGGDREDLERLCERVEEAARVPPNPYVMPYEDNLPVYRCMGMKVPLATLWPQVKHYE
jgi:4-amino-4-deoxy-L-arabinose transferase-like glycosyltransferase